MFLPSNLFVVYEGLPLVFQFQHCAKCRAAVGVGSHLGDIPRNKPGIMAKCRGHVGAFIPRSAFQRRLLDLIF
jgi:hypothetical protein